MSAINRKMFGARWTLAGIIVFVACLMAVYVAFAQGRTVTMKSTFIIHTVQFHTIKAGDVPDHILEVGENRGLQINENGERADYVCWWLWDQTKSSAKGYGYGVSTYKDGSTTVIRFEESTVEEKGGNYSSSKGTFTYTGGSGRFKGIQGKGTFTQTRMNQDSDGYVESTATYTLP